MHVFEMHRNCTIVSHLVYLSAQTEVLLQYVYFGGNQTGNVDSIGNIVYKDWFVCVIGTCCVSSRNKSSSK